jgi:hypothetical protein
MVTTYNICYSFEHTSVFARVSVVPPAVLAEIGDAGSMQLSC